MNRNTAAGMRSACAKVLSAQQGGESLDIMTLDVEDALKRFQHLKAKDLKPTVLEAYKRRFRQAISSFLTHSENPGAWKPAQTHRTMAKVRDAGRGGNRQPQTEPATRRDDPVPPGLVEYPYPLRDHQIARLILPRDLKTSEVRRLSAFMSTLVVDFVGTSE